MASLQGECRLTGQLVFVGRYVGQQKKGKNSTIPAFSILCFSPGCLFSQNF